MKSPQQRGFTLVELLVAIMFTRRDRLAIGYGTINQALKSHDILKDQQAQLLGLQTAMRILEQDFVQAAPRPVRQAIGDEPPQVAFLGAPPGTQPVVALTRAGWSNPAGLQRPGLQRVHYFLENGTLRREYWNVLDPTLASKTVRHDLLEHVKSFTAALPRHQSQLADAVAAADQLPGLQQRAGDAPAPARGRDHHRDRGLGQDRAHHRDRRMSGRVRRHDARLPGAAPPARASRCWWRCMLVALGTMIAATIGYENAMTARRGLAT